MLLPLLKVWGRQDLNPHGLSATVLGVRRGCQLRHVPRSESGYSVRPRGLIEPMEVLR